MHDPKEENVKADEIWYYFLKEPLAGELEEWRRTFAGSFRGRLLFPGQSEGAKERGAGRAYAPDGAVEKTSVEKELADAFLKGRKEGKALFLISDSAGLCRTAESCGVPFLAYLDDFWEGGDFVHAVYGVQELCAVTPRYVERVRRRFYRQPWDILETERCLLREMTEADVDALYEIYRDPETGLYMESLYEDRDEERAYIRDYIQNVYEFYGFGIWAVILKETGELIGRAGLTYREGYDTPELGYVIAAPYRRKGIAAEVCAAILQYGFEELGFEEVRALVDPANAASQRLCRRIGFWKDGKAFADGKERQQYRLTQGKYRLTEEWHGRE